MTFPALSFTVPPLLSPTAPAVVVFIFVLYFLEKSSVAQPLPPSSEQLALIVLLPFVHASLPPVTVHVGGVISIFTVLVVHFVEFPALS